VSEHKSGTQMVRELSQTFRDTAEATQFDPIKEKLSSLADTMEPIAGKLYFKTQKGTDDMIEYVDEMADIQKKLADCADAGAAESLCNPYFERLEKTIKHVKTMKVRMT